MKKMAKKVNTRQRGNTFSYYFSLGKVAGKYKKIEKGGFDTEITLVRILNVESLSRVLKKIFSS